MYRQKSSQNVAQKRWPQPSFAHHWFGPTSSTLQIHRILYDSNLYLTLSPQWNKSKLLPPILHLTCRGKCVKLSSMSYLSMNHIPYPSCGFTPVNLLHTSELGPPPPPPPLQISDINKLDSDKRSRNITACSQGHNQPHLSISLSGTHRSLFPPGEPEGVGGWGAKKLKLTSVNI